MIRKRDTPIHKIIDQEAAFEKANVVSTATQRARTSGFDVWAILANSHKM